MQAPDFSHLWGNDKFADVELLLREEQEQGQDADGSAPPPEELVLRCHAAVLMGFSPYFKTKLEDWDTAPETGSRKSARRSAAQDSPAQRHRVDLPVPRGQLDVGQLLVRSMYAAVPGLSGANQRQLTQLLLLADRYEVDKVTAAVSAAIEAIPMADFAWDTLTGVYSLPAGAAELPGCRGLFAAAAAKLQHELGDLELVWADSGKQQLLLNLPFAALRQLLQDDNTRVASECTVLYTIERWYEELQQQPSQEQQPSKQQLRQLVGLVRMQQCGRSYVTTIFAGSYIADATLTRLELAAACAVASAGSSSSSGNIPAKAPAEADWPVVQPFPAWTQGGRPTTARAAALEWHVPATELRVLFEGHAAGGKSMLSPYTVFGGVPCQLVLVVAPNTTTAPAGTTGSASSSDQNLDVRICVHVPEAALSKAAVCHVGATMLAMNREQSGLERFFGSARLALTRGCCAGKTFHLEGVGSSAAYVRRLKQRNLVMEDGSMLLQLKINVVH